MARRMLADKPIQPWREALLDTWIYPALATVLLGSFVWPGGDVVLLALATVFGCFGAWAYLAMLKTHRRRLAWQQEQARHHEQLQRHLSLLQDDSFSLE